MAWGRLADKSPFFSQLIVEMKEKRLITGLLSGTEQDPLLCLRPPPPPPRRRRLYRHYNVNTHPPTPSRVSVLKPNL
ncbi:hypothetical protein EYF80_007276 [Liparis tanakae]|uniref:Uncharacterized protein n=1 Tax=Liparis tanakae TaxID=230148 RepID=A0A4Z2IXF6_9TELE|nr:hypothetical protein EYF80_007276 [Liparis tanakae]